MHSRNLWQAMSRPGFLLSAWPWRATAYLLTGTMTGVAVLVGIATMAAVCGALAIVLVGLPLFVVVALSGIPVAGAERCRLRLIDHNPVSSRHQVPAAPGLRAWLITRLREQATWRELGYALLFAGLLWPVDAL
ncbi:sensor domain-containing protein, partial [Streptomyces sp. NPDC088921]|uniref:sensor domain-containing protein n=1 Tax=Streptomyces sp. NPDC088921 TaxID=3155062 RepID=UPI00341E9CA8